MDRLLPEMVRSTPTTGGRGRRSPALAAALSATAALVLRPLVTRAALLKLRRDVRALNEGDYGPVLCNYAQDAVLRFNDGEHRWAGEHRGKHAIEEFLRQFVAAGLRGRITELFVCGPPWRMTLLARYDDEAHDPAGAQLYSNRTVLLARLRWGRIVLHEDFYEDTRRIEAFDARLRELGR